MHDIRDLVLDLKSSLHMQSQHDDKIQQNTPNYKAPTTLRYKKSPLKYKETTNDTLRVKQHEMFERLNKTMDRLSNKIDILDDQDKTSDKSSVFEEERDETFNSISKLSSTIIPHLQRMNNRVDDLHKTLNERERKTKMREVDDGQLLRHQSQLVKSLESKLNNIEQKLEKPNNRSGTSICAFCGNVEEPSHISNTKHCRHRASSSFSLANGNFANSHRPKVTSSSTRKTPR